MAMPSRRLPSNGVKRRFSPRRPKLLRFAEGTFTRSSEASYLTSASTIAWASVDVLRKEDRGDGHGAVALFEGSRTNLALYSEDFSQTSGTWDHAGDDSYTPNDAAAPDGDIEALTISGSAGTRVFQDVAEASLADNTTYTLSAWVRLASGADGDFILQVVDKAGSVTNSSTLTATSQWQRFSLSFDSGTGTNDVNIKPLRRPAGVSSATFEVWGAQVEEGSFPSSYIRTSGAAATRAADDLSFASGDVPDRIKSGKWKWAFLPYWGSGEEQNDPYLLAFGASSDDSLRFTDGPKHRVRAGGTDVVQTNNLSFDRHQKLGVTYDAGAGDIDVSGATSGNGTYSGTPWTWPDGETLRIGYLDSVVGFESFGRITEPEAA